MIETALSGDFVGARNKLDEIMLTYGLSGEDIIKQIHRSFFDLSIPDQDKVRLIDKTGEIEFRIVEGSNERIQLESLLAYLVAGRRKGLSIANVFIFRSIFQGGEDSYGTIQGS